MAREHVFDSVHKEHRIGELPRESLQYLLFCGPVGNFLFLLPNSSARKMAEEPPVKY